MPDSASLQSELLSPLLCPRLTFLAALILASNSLLGFRLPPACVGDERSRWSCRLALCSTRIIRPSSFHFCDPFQVMLIQRKAWLIVAYCGHDGSSCRLSIKRRGISTKPPYICLFWHRLKALPTRRIIVSHFAALYCSFQLRFAYVHTLPNVQTCSLMLNLNSLHFHNNEHSDIHQDVGGSSSL
jgi:hypothetical protein